MAIFFKNITFLLRAILCVGEWKEGQKNGKGIFYWADGSIYEGEFKNGNKES